MIDLDQHDRFVVIRRRRVTPAPFMDSVDCYEFALADAERDTPPICHVRQRVSRLNRRVDFYADEAETVSLMHLNARPRFDPWARYELADLRLNVIGEIQKVFVQRHRRSHYLLYDHHGAQVGRVEALPVAVGRRRAARVGVAALAAAVAIPVIGASGLVAAGALAVASAARQLRDRVDPIDVAGELLILNGDKTLGVFVRQSPSATAGSGTPPIPVPWRSATSTYEVDMRADRPKTVDRRLVLAVPVALDALRGVFADTPLR